MTAFAKVIRETGLSAVILAIGQRLVPPHLTGRLCVTLPSGRVIELGDRHAAHPARLYLRNWRPLWRAMRRSSVGFCESYVDGDWDSPAPEKVLGFYLQNREAFSRASRLLMRKSLAVKLWHRLRANSKRGAKRNIEAHYDIGNDF